MQNHQKKYDVAIIGGGLAGLALSIQLAKKNYSVILFEKEKYPFQVICFRKLDEDHHHDGRCQSEIPVPVTPPDFSCANITLAGHIHPRLRICHSTRV